MPPALPQTEADDALRQRMAALGVREEDLEESFVRSGGHGGQNVNKTSTCVMLLHRPSGLRVKCQDTRQQGQNRDRARWLLLEKLETQQRREAEAARAARAKLRRQKRRRSPQAKARILADKKHQSVKKARRRPGGED